MHPWLQSHENEPFLFSFDGYETQLLPTGEKFEDFNNDGKWTNAEDYEDLNNDGKWSLIEKEKIIDGVLENTSITKSDSLKTIPEILDRSSEYQLDESQKGIEDDNVIKFEQESTPKINLDQTSIVSEIEKSSKIIVDDLAKSENKQNITNEDYEPFTDLNSNNRSGGSYSLLISSNVELLASAVSLSSLCTEIKSFF